MSKTFLSNKRALFDYEIQEKFVAGIVLLGKEVKSIKNKRGKLDGSYAYIQKGEIFILNFDIPEYQAKNTMGKVDPGRTRKLLLKKKEINYLTGKLNEKRFTLIPLKVFQEKGKVKLELGLGKGKTKLDKRENIKKRETKRDLAREGINL